VPDPYALALRSLYAAQRRGIHPGLASIRTLLERLEIPPDLSRGGRRPIILHVAGTNGKGSVCAFADAICRAAGLRTALYTSPHLLTFRERIRCNGAMIPADAVVALSATLASASRDLDPAPTFFELATALALLHFLDQQPDVVILETGLGGRLDATNTLAKNVAVITPIGLDHREFLGDSLAAIAAEKAGILAERTPALSSPQEPDAETVLRAEAARRHAPLRFVDEPLDAAPIGLAGSHQRLNAALAATALATAGIEIPEHALRAGLANVDWPARFQLLAPDFVLDGAHNPHAARRLAATWREVFPGTRATLVLGMMADKDSAAFAEALAPIAAETHAAPLRSPRALDPATLAARVAPALDATPHPSLAAALDRARASGRPVLVTGSLHLAGDLLHLLNPAAEIDPPSLQ
jgi:dihydrofolate synthase/folylpolyglutamate synthase